MKKPHDLLAMQYTEQQAIAAFWAKVQVKGPDECWVWKAGKDRDGYGKVKWRGKDRKAHRVAFYLARGFSDVGENVCHTCDVPACCNPKHLFAGTQQLNREDCVWKDRQARGERQGSAKLTEAEVGEIRQQYATGLVTQQDLALRYNVADSTIRNVVHRKSWRHLA